MAKAQPKNPRNTPEAAEGTGNTLAAQEQGQDNTAQGNNDDASKAAADAEAAAAKAAIEAEVQAAEAARAEAEAKEAATAGAAAVEAVAAASAALATVAQVLAAEEQAAPAAPEGPVRDEQGRLEYEVVSPLNNGKRYEIGARVWLSDEEAGPLLGHTVTPYKPTAATDEDEGAAHA